MASRKRTVKSPKRSGTVRPSTIRKAARKVTSKRTASRKGTATTRRR